LREAMGIFFIISGKIPLSQEQMMKSFLAAMPKKKTMKMLGYPDNEKKDEARIH
jgi:hypothetical protein